VRSRMRVLAACSNRAPTQCRIRVNISPSACRIGRPLHPSERTFASVIRSTDLCQCRTVMKAWPPRLDTAVAIARTGSTTRATYSLVIAMVECPTKSRRRKAFAPA
jgi:hypothetical protein